MLDWSSFESIWIFIARVQISNAKAPKSLVNQGKNEFVTLRYQEAAGSNPVTPTT